MLGVVFFRFQVEKKWKVTPSDKDKQDKQKNAADSELKKKLLQWRYPILGIVFSRNK
jgi:hypothetical protein